jgi:hypothetical protein
MTCQECFGPMRRGEVEDPADGEVVFLCKMCGYSCTEGGGPWALDFNPKKWTSRAWARGPDSGNLECPKCRGPRRGVKFQEPNGGDLVLLCKWCGYSYEP